MALPPKFKGHRLAFYEAAAAPELPQHTVEVFLDYVCPFSAKLFNTVYNTLTPALRADPVLSRKVQFVFGTKCSRGTPSSTLAHEAGLAVQRLAPSQFWAFSAALFGAQKEFFDVSVVGETRNETYKRLAQLAASSTGGSVDADEVYKLLAIPGRAADDGSLNVGNAVTNDLKVVVKMARLVGVHVSPTVIFDGVVANDISSSWTVEQWLDWLKKNVA